MTSSRRRPDPAEQGWLFAAPPPVVEPTPHFDGRTYDESLDRDRLWTQFCRTRDLMRDGQWRSLREISAALGDPEASISARLRDLRKERFGGWIVARRRRDLDSGTWEYRVRAPNKDEKPEEEVPF
jgi:hypothetical protein